MCKARVLVPPTQPCNSGCLIFGAMQPPHTCNSGFRLSSAMQKELRAACSCCTRDLQVAALAAKRVLPSSTSTPALAWVSSEPFSCKRAWNLRWHWGVCYVLLASAWFPMAGTWQGLHAQKARSVHTMMLCMLSNHGHVLAICNSASLLMPPGNVRLAACKCWHLSQGSQSYTCNIGTGLIAP